MNHLEPHVCILIPTFNQAEFISNALFSAINQDYTNTKIIVCDDCSTDQTFQLAEGIANQHKNVFAYRNEYNLGRVENYRKLLYLLSSDQYCINLDGDDEFLDSQLISKSVKLLSSNPKAVFCQSRQIRSPKKPINPTFTNNKYQVYNGINYVVNIYATSRSNHLTTLYNRQIAIDSNFYSQDIISSDAESTLKAALHGDVILREDIAALWRHHGNNESGTSDVETLLHNYETLTNSISKELLDRGVSLTIIRKWKKKMAIQYLFPIFKIALKKKTQRVSLGYIMKHIGASSLFIGSYPLKYLLVKANILSEQYLNTKYKT